jgi:hypothetical protein
MSTIWEIDTEIMSELHTLINSGVQLRTFCCSDTHISIFFFFFCGHWSLWWTLTSFMIARHWSQSCDFRLQFPTSQSNHLIVGLPTCSAARKGWGGATLTTVGGPVKKWSFFKFSSFTCDFSKFEIPTELPMVHGHMYGQLCQWWFSTEAV